MARRKRYIFGGHYSVTGTLIRREVPGKGTHPGRIIDGYGRDEPCQVVLCIDGEPRQFSLDYILTSERPRWSRGTPKRSRA